MTLDAGTEFTCFCFSNSEVTASKQSGQQAANNPSRKRQLGQIFVPVLSQWNLRLNRKREKAANCGTLLKVRIFQ
jgi:hypothetical protein